MLITWKLSKEQIRREAERLQAENVELRDELDRVTRVLEAVRVEAEARCLTKLTMLVEDALVHAKGSE